MLRKKKNEFSKSIVVLVVVLNSLFTAATLYSFFKTGNEPTALITAWFGFTTGELWLLSSIKKTKVKQGLTEPVEEMEEEIFDEINRAR